MNLQDLKKPFPVGKLKWRVGQKSKDKKKANMLVYIDSRDVQDRLDEVCGMGGWQDSYQEYSKSVTETDWKTKEKSTKHFNKTNCSIAIKINNEWISKTDGAGDTNVEAEKGSNSDSFKRAGVKWGIGRYLYNASNYNTWVNCDGMSDWDIYKNNKEQLDKVARDISNFDVNQPNVELGKPATDEKVKEFIAWGKKNNKSADEVISIILGKLTLTNEQKESIRQELK